MSNVSGTRTRRRGAVALLALLLPTVPVAAQEISPPAGVTVERVQQGMQLYQGKGACAPCHGDLGVGTADGPTLVTGQWKLGSGSYEWLCHIVRHAGWGSTSPSGDPQAMRGPTVLDSSQVNLVAAYVWSISRGRKAPPPQ
jgi:mono/diheme cytochrome c family protein